jgi:hypothetical protein
MINHLGNVSIENAIEELLEIIPKEFHIYLNKDNEVGLLSSMLLLSCNQKRTVIIGVVRAVDNIVAGIDGNLHRISSMMSKVGEIYSLTFRVGHSVSGNAGLIKDILQSTDLHRTSWFWLDHCYP